MGHDPKLCPKHYGRASVHVMMEEDIRTQAIVLEHKMETVNNLKKQNYIQENSFFLFSLS
jgi:hypothetical protein